MVTVQQWQKLFDKENSATVQSIERLQVTMFHLTTAIYWLDEAPINSQKYQLRAASHIAVSYEEIVELDSIYYQAGGVLAATRWVVRALETTDEVEKTWYLHNALECLYGSWYDFNHGKEVETNG